MKKLLLLLAKGVIVLQLIWLVVGNVLLNTALGPWLMSIRQEKFTMTWDNGWTLYPARVSLNDVAMEIHTWSTDAEIRMDHAEGDLRILPLLNKRAVIENLHVGTASVIVNRQKPDGERPAPSKPYPGMIIDVRDAVVDSVDRFVFNRFSVTGGDNRARGSATIQFRGDKVIEVVNAEWLGAIVGVDNVPLPETVDITVSGGMSAFNPRHDKGLQLAEKITGRVQLNGDVGTLVPLELFFPGMDWIERIDGDGSVAVDAIIEKGRLQQGTVIDIDANNLLLEFLGYAARGSGRVDSAVSNTDDGRSGEIRIIFDEFSLARRGIDLPLVRGEDLLLRTRSSELGLLRGLSDLEVTLELPESEVPDVTVLNEFLPPSLNMVIDRGSARMNAMITVAGPEREASASLNIRGEGLAGHLRDTAFQVDLSLDSEALSEQLDDFQMDLGGTRFRLFNGIFDNEDVEVDERWWMNIDIPAGTADLSKPFAIDADMTLAMKDTRAIIALFAAIKEWISKFDGFLTVQDVAGSASVSIADKSLRMRDLSVSGDRLDLMAEVSAGEGRNDALVWGKLGVFSGGFERLDGETKWKLVNGRQWFDTQKQDHWTEDTR